MGHTVLCASEYVGKNVEEMRDLVVEIRLYRPTQRDSRKWWQIWKRLDRSKGIIFMCRAQANQSISVPFVEGGLIGPTYILHGFQYEPSYETLSQERRL